MIDSSDIVTRNGIIINQLVYKNLQREDLFKMFDCQASNTNKTHPITRKVKVVLNRKFDLYTFKRDNFDPILFKDNQMRSPSLLSGPKIRKAFFEASNRKMLLHRLSIKSDFKGPL